ncbi:hypothetical protein RGQ21_18450 [Kitasatospora aureofaciens]|nr:hypothetical protein RGQ21_18450 [Kitasatospora aureofaciens]
MPDGGGVEAVGAVGEGDVDLGVGVVGEGDDVVVAVAVDVADGGDFAAGGEVVVPDGGGCEAVAVGEGDVDVGFGALGEGDDVVLVVAVEVAGEGVSPPGAKKSCQTFASPNSVRVDGAT